MQLKSVINTTIWNEPHYHGTKAALHGAQLLHLIGFVLSPNKGPQNVEENIKHSVLVTWQ